MEETYHVTAKGLMTLDLANSLDAMLQEQREAFYLSLRDAARRMAQGDNNLNIALALVDTLAIAGLVPSGTTEDTA